MRSVPGVLCAVVMIVGMPQFAFAQGMLPGGPGFGPPLPAFYYGSPRPASAKPSISTGYVWDSRKTHFSLTADGTGLGGIRERRRECELSALYVSGSLPVIMRNMGGMVLSGSWATPSPSDSRADDFDPPGTYLVGRTWTGKTSWATAEVLLAYSFQAGFSGVAGYRWDYLQTGYSGPRDVSAGFVAAARTDSADFYMETWLPFVGVAGSYWGLRFAGIAGVTSGGTVKYEEVRNGGGSQRLDVFEGNLDKAYFIELTGEYTVASGFTQGGTQAELSIFGKYNLLKTEADLTGQRTGTATAQDTFDFELRRDLFVVGAEASVTF